MSDDTKVENIAIVGMAGRFPKSSNVRELWDNIKAGRECITFFDEDELEIKPSQEKLESGRPFIAAKGILEDIEGFDAKFWGYTPKEARLIDPQQRVFLESAWEAMEDAGYDSSRLGCSVGVYAGCYVDTYLLWNLASDPEFLSNWVESIQVGSLQTELGNDKDYIATRAAFKMDLRGPAINVQSACSTSLVAVSMAYQALMAYQCDMAIAGGVTITLPQKKGYFYTEGGMLSGDGHCRAFDASASGTVFSNAGAAIVLKRESDAIADGDNIIALIRGAALNNDGGKKLSYTAPSVEGQAEVIATAQAIGETDARTIGYIEAHGTATPLGDPIEVAGLTAAFRQTTEDNGFCALGSVKTNIGHLDVASGVTGVIKTALMLRDRVLTPSLNYETPNPNIDFEETPFYVNTELREWPSEAWPRRAGVSSFGVGGTNAHVVLEEFCPQAQPEPSKGPWLVPMSARSTEALVTYAHRLGEHLAQGDDDPGDVAFTFQEGRREFEHRAVFVADTRESLIKKLQAFKGKGADYRKARDREPGVVFMFPGQGSQHPGMARDLYDNEPTFRHWFDQCAEILQRRIGLDLYSVVYENTDPEVLKETGLAQPAIFTIEYALARMWIEMGVEPVALIGHSVGEYTAGAISGVFSLEDALVVVARRGSYMQQAAPGSMLSVRAPYDDVRKLLPKDLDLAAYNAPELSVVSGSDPAIERFIDQLEGQDIPCSRLHTSHAFHSRMMDGAVAPTLEALRQIELKAPKIPIMSTVDGGWLSEDSATDPAYWGRNLRDTVMFAAGIQELIGEKQALFLEVGPGQTLSTLAKQSAPADTDVSTVASLPHAKDDKLDRLEVLSAFGRLWANGEKMSWKKLPGGRGRRVSLPTYPFERKRHWIDATEDFGRASHPAPLADPNTATAEARQLVEQQMLIIDTQLKILSGRR